MSGYELSRFVGLSQSDAEEYICSICQDILRKPVVTYCCSQTFCEQCINVWLSTNNKCPYDRRPLNRSQLSTPPRIVTNVLGKMKIRCIYDKNGCKEILMLDNLENHEKSCGFNKKICEKCSCYEPLIHDCFKSLLSSKQKLAKNNEELKKCYEQVHANVCEECTKPIGIDSKDLSYKEKHWHETCFLCNKCKVSLVGKPFGSKFERIYCGDCYNEQFASRCDGCSEILKAGTLMMEYKGKQWHETCFCCFKCKTSIGNKTFVSRENDIFCTDCFEERYATRCVKCSEVINASGVIYKNEPWHKECFNCNACGVSLAGVRFTTREDRPYCSTCFGSLYAKKCDGCLKPIVGVGGTKFISFEDRNWHKDCFNCTGCQTTLVGKGFITDGPDVLCRDCAKSKLQLS